MDMVRFGRIIRALRLRRRWRQRDLAERALVSQSLIARVERGGGRAVTVRTLERILEALGARLSIRVDWNGEAADRLLDADHAALVERVVRALVAQGWQAIPEASFVIDRERGSIDVLGWHARTGTLLLVEVKSVIPDVQATFHVFDRKVRLGRRIGKERGWDALRIASVLAVGESRTARRRVELHEATFDARVPDRTVGVKRFLADPSASPVRGLWFLSSRTEAGSRQRVSTRRAAA
jgi:transcriptional regulator with XRE-family HTH domain